MTDDEQQPEPRTPKTPTKRSERMPDLIWPGVPTDRPEAEEDGRRG